MKGMDFADQLFCRLMVVKDPAQVSALPQLQWPRTAMLTACGTPTTLTSPPATSVKIPVRFGGILFFIFITLWKNKWLVMMSYFRMDLLCLQSSLKAAAKGCVYCWVCWFVCFKMTHSNNFCKSPKMEVCSSELSKQPRPTEMFLHGICAHAQECMTAF